MAFPQPLRGEREGEAGVAQVQLTWGATIVQSLANSTCPERVKMMTLRKEVNHMTHSKSATSWGRSRQVKVGWRQSGLVRVPAPSPLPEPSYTLEESSGRRSLPSHLVASTRKIS